MLTPSGYSEPHSESGNFLLNCFSINFPSPAGSNCPFLCSFLCHLRSKWTQMNTKRTIWTGRIWKAIYKALYLYPLKSLATFYEFIKSHFEKSWLRGTKTDLSVWFFVIYMIAWSVVSKIKWFLPASQALRAYFVVLLVFNYIPKGCSS
jgi:hypothetical protein